MKFFIFIIVADFVSAQYMLDEEGSRFASTVFNTMISCNQWIEQGREYVLENSPKNLQKSKIAEIWS